MHLRAPHEVRTVFHTAEKVRRPIEYPVSPHLTNCTCGSKTDQKDTGHLSLSLRVWFYWRNLATIRFSLGFVQTGRKQQIYWGISDSNVFF